MRGEKWTRVEMILAFNRYLQLPLGKKYTRTHQTIETNLNELLFDIKCETKIREMVIANYSCKCAITGIDIPDLPFASHITSWAYNDQERLNPKLGICLSALYNKAFDKERIGFDKSFQVVFSTNLQKHAGKEYFVPIEKIKLHVLQKYLLKHVLLKWNLDTIFEKNKEVTV